MKRVTLMNVMGGELGERRKEIWLSQLGDNFLANKQDI
jgi:hypothetical protein